MTPINAFSKLTNETAYCTFSSLTEIKDVHSLLLTDKRLNQCASTDRTLWERLVRSRFPDSSQENPNQTHPKDLYRSLKIANDHIRTGQFRTHTYTHQLKRDYNQRLRKDKIIGHDSDTIKVWDFYTGKKLRSFERPRQCCYDLQEDKVIYFDFTRKIISVWEVKNGKKLCSIAAPHHDIDKITLQIDKIFSTSCGKITIWDLNTGKELHTLEHSPSAISALASNEGLLASSSFDCSVKVWNLNTGKEICSFAGHFSAHITILALKSGKLAAGYFDGRIIVWDLKTGKGLHFQDHKHRISCLALQDEILVSGSFIEGTIILWDINTGKKLHTFTGDENSFKGLWMQGGKLHSHWINGGNNIFDFNLLSLSPYSEKILEENLSLLEQMVYAEQNGDAAEIGKLNKTLHSDFKKLLEQHALKCNKSFKITEEVIMRVQMEVCLELLLDRIHNSDRKRVSTLLDQLVSIDDRSAQLFENLGNSYGFEGGIWGKYAFHERNGYEWAASSKQKENAVLTFKKFLKEQWGPDLSPLLVGFKVVSKKDHSEKLRCTSDVLKKIGILSLDDLNALGLLTKPPVERLNIPKETPPENNVQDTIQQTKCLVMKKLDKLSKETTERIRENNNFGYIFLKKGSRGPYDYHSPWAVFRDELKVNRTSINVLGKIIEKTHDLVKEFNAIDREYQIFKLRIYIHQDGLDQKWASLRQQKIQSLDVFAKKNPAVNLYEMGDDLPTTQ